MPKTYKIHPAIGFARLGNSLGNVENQNFFFGPEQPGIPAGPPDGRYRDAAGALKRQATRFRVFEYDSDHPGVATEVNIGAQVTRIEWTVHLANKKSFWYQFNGLRGEQGYAASHPRRNSDPDNRSKWIIDFGPRTVAQGEGKTFERGGGGGYPETGPTALTNQPTPGTPLRIDYLGELQGDAQGRLTVLGARGTSGALRPQAVQTFQTSAEYANNPEWFDDTSDGPVTATLHLAGGGTVSAAQAWVMVGPPDYAPPVVNLVTMWDTLHDMAVRNVPSFAPAIYDSAARVFRPGYEPSYTRDIFPILQRAARYRAVQEAARGHHRWDREESFRILGEDPYVAPDIPNFRSPSQIVAKLRRPGNGNDDMSDELMPQLFGDSGVASSLTLTATQYFFMQQWRAGTFNPDWTGMPVPPGGNPTAEGLDRAALEAAVGGAFFPGIEASWIMRRAAIYESNPFNFRFKPAITDEFNLDGLTPGSITMRSACPWQADFYECKDAWWPAARPDQVIRNGVSDDWHKGVKAATTEMSDYNMVLKWHLLGIVKETAPGVFAEDERTMPEPIA